MQPTRIIPAAPKLAARRDFSFLEMMKSPLPQLLLLWIARGVESDCPENTLWCEDFEDSGSPNSDFWSYDLGQNNGWGNNEVQSYTEENVVIEDGAMKILITRDGDDFFSARLKTQDKVMFQYVTVNARIKLPNLEGGIWPALWLLGDNFDTVGWPACGEIDIAEWGSVEARQQGKLNETVSSAMHWNDPTRGGHVYTTEAGESPLGSLAEGFHEYKVIWTQDTVSTYVDEMEVMSKSIADLEEFHRPLFLLVNVAVGGRFTGITNPTSQGGTMEIDWIRVEDNGDDSLIYCEKCSGANQKHMTSWWGNLLVALLFFTFTLASW